ncbi:Threonine synthase-like 2 [Sciurus carolinensis]|uniref:Threonine synthase-like 2 n=1 Tax=Sciurus carolinensis TaxID=30640 RepID=A0AA41NFM1_SCICA|nr:Threonine synthase-like 2 [Sciurus carolinensis]
MWYVSTRGMAPRVDFEGALFSGYAPDGGLYMPEDLPQLDRETLRRWSLLSYPGLVKELCSLFIGPELIPRDDLDAGCAAVKMGLPVRLAAVVNHNDIVHRAIRQGDFSLSEAVRPSLASAMDIQVPYNMERILWLFSGSSGQVTRALMEQFERTQSLQLPEELRSKISEAVTSESVSDEAITRAMGRCWRENQYLLCPHSAVAVSYHYQQTDGQRPSPPRCCLAPASAAKFPEAVLAAGLTPETPADILALEHKETRCSPMRRGDDWTLMLRDTIERLSRRWRASASRQGSPTAGGFL